MAAKLKAKGREADAGSGVFVRKKVVSKQVNDNRGAVSRPAEHTETSGNADGASSTVPTRRCTYFN